MPGVSEKPLFFGSDTEEEQDQAMEVDKGNESRQTKDKSKKRLFLSDSEGETNTPAPEVRSTLKDCPINATSSSSVIRSSPRPPRELSITSLYSVSPPPVKKRKVTPPVVKKEPVVAKTAPQKPKPKPKAETPMSERTGFHNVYIGSLLVPNAWSTCKGRGWAKAGEEIFIRRAEEETSSSKGSSKPMPKAASGKQMKLTSMFKANAAPKPVKKGKVDNVVRFTNSRGFEIGRLPQEVASWVAKLMDQGIVNFKNCTVVDCPENLRTGDEMLIQLCIYLLAEAFRQHRPSISQEEARSMFNEGQETLDEQVLRERKASLLKLFQVLDIKPIRKNAFLRESGSTTDVPEKMMTQSNKDENPLKPVDKGRGEVRSEGGDEEEEEVLTEGELDMIYKKAQKNDSTMQEMDPADTFTFTLRPYQKQALLWMHSLESGMAAARDADSMHPLWEEYQFPYEELADGIIDITDDPRLFYFNPYSGELSVTFPKVEKTCRGGILADVGMGKTIMISSLLHTSRDPESVDPPGTNPAGQSTSTQARPRQLKLDASFRPINDNKPITLAPTTTLIVAPTSLMDQWAKELGRSSVKGSIEVLVWHGQNRDDLDTVLVDQGKINIVITSYGILGSEWTKHETTRNGSPLFQVEWLRVVLDEAHNCKSRLSRTAKACCALKARRRWALTGTPIVNKLEDLYSLLKFLDFAPWSDYSFFRSFITLPFLNQDPKAVEIVQVILESVLLRREKNMRDRDGKRIVDLPAKEITVEHLDFTLLERKIYDSLYSDAKNNYDRLKAKGLVGKNYTHILAMLMRLRRAVLHPSLVQIKEREGSEVIEEGNGQVDVDTLIAKFKTGTDDDTEAPSATFAEDVLTKLDEAHSQECALCLDLMDQPVLAPDCFHSCCKSCALAFLQSCEEKGEEGRCPICRNGPIKESQLLEIVRRKPVKQMPVDDDNEDLCEDRKSSPAVVLRKNDFNSSTKLNALSEDLRRLRDQDPCFRAVVFSQFTSFLDLIEVVLRRDGFAFYRFDGEMNVKKKAEAVEEFTRPSRSGKVFVVSLKAGGVGLNLTVADHVYMMDCWWNSAMENQAIDRVHRIGQERTVHVKQFIISNTIEDRILQIQKRKTAMVKGALGGKEGDTDSMENLKIMFGE